MYLIEIDSKRNHMRVVFAGQVDEEQAGSYYRELEERAPAELAEGFEILTDLSELDHLTHEATRYVRKSMDLCNQLGVQRVIRIIPHPSRSFAFNLMSYFHYDRQVSIVTCKSPEELAARKGHSFKAAKVRQKKKPLSNLEQET